MLWIVSEQTIGAQLKEEEGGEVEGETDLDDGADGADEIRSGLASRFLVELR